ncbi:DUF11 domain-containing protein [candidate division WOR-3 bacterium]|nr:DUF11 domain-containing protein [candidate division WOR-3 bacterium]
MNDKKSKSVSVTGILSAENIGKAVFISLLLLATTFVASAQPCDHNVTVEDTCCLSSQTYGWFYNETTGNWNYSSPSPHEDWTFLFYLDVDYGDKYWAYCINYTAPLWTGDTFNASIYNAEPTCKNNSIAHILNNWTYSCAHCENVSASQSAIWYFWYINESFCRLDNPQYNHTATPTDPGWESNWIPNCTAHPEACDFINTSINKSVPYNVTLAPKTGDYIKGTSIELEAAVDYCGVEEVVTVVFETDAGNFSESGTNVYENATINGKAKATLVCDAESANVTARVKDMKWFDIVDPIGCQATDYQETLRIINLTDDANFNFYDAPELGSWEGYVYEDPNCNCSYDDEQGVPNVNVSLHNASGWEDTTKTNASGYYLFTNLTPGLYWASYDAVDLPEHLEPKCDDDGGSTTESDAHNVPADGRYRHDFAVESEADIGIVKLVDGVKVEEVTHNQTVTYTLNITNTGVVNLTNITVVDTLPADITWADAANPGEDSVDGKTITWKSTLPAVLEPDKWFVIRFNATVNEDAECDKTHRNWAKVNATSDWGDVGPKSDYADVYIECHKVPLLTPFGIAALIGLLSLVVVYSMSKSMRRKKG